MILRLTKNITKTLIQDETNWPSDFRLDALLLDLGTKEYYLLGRQGIDNAWSLYAGPRDRLEDIGNSLNVAVDRDGVEKKIIYERNSHPEEIHIPNPSHTVPFGQEGYSAFRNFIGQSGLVQSRMRRLI